jgi:polyisoprenoid-binding protein YceI
MKKLLFLSAFVFTGLLTIKAQPVYFTRNGLISFYSQTPLENIEAKNNEVASKLNAQNGALEIQLLIKGFQFKKAAMQEHFNEKEYMDSDHFPKAVFKGTITDINKVDFKKNNSYPVTAEGDLSLHGVTNKIKATGTLVVKDDAITITTSFILKLSDYNVKVPAIVSKKVAETVEVKMDCVYQLYKG